MSCEAKKYPFSSFNQWVAHRYELYGETRRWHGTKKLISHAVQIVSGQSLQKAVPDVMNILTFKSVESSKEEEVKEWWQASCK